MFENRSGFAVAHEFVETRQTRDDGAAPGRHRFRHGDTEGFPLLREAGIAKNIHRAIARASFCGLNSGSRKRRPDRAPD